MTPGVRALAVACALGCGTAGGVFFAFSAFVMNGLARLSPSQGVAAMQAINVAAVRPLFMASLFGTAAGCAVLLVHAARHRGSAGAGYLAAACVLYLVGVIGVTMARNVPLNDTLAALDATDAASAAVWQGYLVSWTRWNHLRTVCALAATGALTVALIVTAGAKS